MNSKTKKWSKIPFFLHWYCRSELICRVKYGNTLPDIPFDPKFLAYPFDPQRFVNYKATSLEKDYKFELQTESDMGITVDLVLPDAYALPLGMTQEEVCMQCVHYSNFDSCQNGC